MVSQGVADLRVLDDVPELSDRFPLLLKLGVDDVFHSIAVVVVKPVFNQLVKFKDLLVIFHFN